MNPPIRLLLADDQELVRAGFKMVLQAAADMQVVAEAADGRAALDLLEQTSPDVVLMDVRMPRMDGIETTRRICARGPRPKVLVLTTFDLDEYAYSALQHGASGFLLKDGGPHELLAAIRAVHRGDAVLAPSTTRRMLEHLAGDQPPPPDGDPRAHPRLAALTPREFDVLIAVAEGLSNTEIAARLFCAETTVKTHIGRLLHKLAVRDRVQLVLLAYRTGLVRVVPES